MDETKRLSELRPESQMSNTLWMFALILQICIPFAVPHGMALKIEVRIHSFH